MNNSNIDRINKKWYIVECDSGESCWCRIISTDTNADDIQNCICTAGSVNKELAEHIVELHNKWLFKFI